MGSVFTDWDTTTEEWFSFLAGSWDVREAKRILAKKPRKGVTFNPADWREFAGNIGGEGPADEKVNLDVPVVFITRKSDGKTWNLPIDGWNRIRKANLQGVLELPAVVLTLTESRKIARGA